MYTNLQLQQLADELNAQFFARPFTGIVRWNSRLRSTAGRFLLHKKCIELNPRYAEHFGLASLVDVLKHELIHYHFPKAKHGPLFRREATRIGCSRFCSPFSTQAIKYVYQCRLCYKPYPRRRRIDVRKYRCSVCRGDLSLL